MSFQTGDQRHDFQVKCPYNTAHQMPHSRLLFHITQGCADKQQYGHLYEHCPYDFLHIIHKDKIETHIQTCSKAKNIDNDLQQSMQSVIQQQFKPKPQQQQQQSQQVTGYLGNNELPKPKKKRNRKKNNVQQQNQTDNQLPQWNQKDSDSEDVN